MKNLLNLFYLLAESALLRDVPCFWGLGAFFSNRRFTTYLNYQFLPFKYVEFPPWGARGLT